MFSLHSTFLLQVSTNGVISFGIPFTRAGPLIFPLPRPPLVAPFYHDINLVRGGTIYYRQTTDDGLLETVRRRIMELSDLRDFKPSLLFIVTWQQVAPFVLFLSGENTFQAILATDGETSVVSFIYGDIQWGQRAEIGFNAGDGLSSLTVPSSGTSATVDIETQSNVGVPGVFFYQVDGKIFEAFYSSVVMCSEL